VNEQLEATVMGPSADKPLLFETTQAQEVPGITPGARDQIPKKCINWNIQKITNHLIFTT
jgi:hypothetical protein